MARKTRTPEDYAWNRYMGAIIERIRIRRGLSQVQVAYRAEISARILAKIERGILCLRLEELYKISCALGVPVITFYPPDWLQWHAKRRRLLVDRLPLRMRRTWYRALGMSVARVRRLRLR